MSDIKNAVLYARFSSDMQHETSIEAQQEAIYKFAEANGYRIVGEYIDRAKTGTSIAKRESFKQMLKDSSAKGFQYVIVHKLDRFARDRYDSAIAKHELKRNNVKVVSVLEHIDDTPESIILEALLEAMAEYYSKNLGREVMKGFKVRAGKCMHNGGQPPLGYDVDEVTKLLVINEKEAEAVRMIFDLYTSGYGYGHIIAELNAHGYKTKCNRDFGKNSIYSIIRNEKYAGYYVYNQWDGKHNRHKRKSDDEVVKIKGGVPAIISEEQFAKAAELMAIHKRAPGSYTAKKTYLLSGLIRCGHCGRAMTGNARQNGKGYRYSSYRCSRGRMDECANKEIVSRKLDEFALAQLEKHIFNEANIPAIIAEVREKYEKRYDGRDKELTDLNNRLNGVRLQQNNIVNAVAGGQGSKLLMDRLAQLEADEQTLIQRIYELENPTDEVIITDEALTEVILKISPFIHKRDIKECKKIVRDFVEQVTVYNDRVEITMKISPEYLCGGEYSVVKGIGRAFLKEPK